MDPASLILLLCFIGGVIAAAVVRHLQRPVGSLDPFHDRRTDVINAARIRVAGIGGLGLVAMAATVALFTPRNRLTLTIGCLLGIALAAILIWRRRRSGALPSSGRSAGANTTLSIDALPPTTPGDQDPPHPRLNSVVTQPAGPTMPRCVRAANYRWPT